MGFFDNLKSNFEKAGQQHRKRMVNTAEKSLRDNKETLSDQQREKLERIAKHKISSPNQKGSLRPDEKEKSIDQWEREWKSIGTLSSIDLSPFSNSVGVYKAQLGGKIKYIGRAVEFNNGGLRKRLSDYRRESDSGRKHKSGKLMYENADNLHISIISTGSDAEAASMAKQLERQFIQKYSPEWNTMLKSKVK